MIREKLTKSNALCTYSGCLEVGSGSEVVQNYKEEFILGFKVCALSQYKIIQNLAKDLKNGKQNIIYNINPLFITCFYKYPKYIENFNSQSYQIPDGIGVVLASKIKNSSIKKRIAGIELFEELLKLAAKEKYKVFLYGAEEELNQKTEEVLKKNYKINIAGRINGYEKEEQALAAIINSESDMLFIALGNPKQEEFIIKNEKALSKIKLIMPVGGSFNVISGNIKRAPNIYQKLHLEWFYRMIKNPKRIFANLGLIKFVFLIVMQNYRDKWPGKSK